MIDGNVLAALITLVALGLAANFMQTNRAVKAVEQMSLKLDLLWKVSPYVDPTRGCVNYQPRAARRPRRR